eukprot:5774332-Pyramimonas_sp.AAC.1
MLPYTSHLVLLVVALVGYVPDVPCPVEFQSQNQIADVSVLERLRTAGVARLSGSQVAVPTVAGAAPTAAGAAPMVDGAGAGNAAA